MKFHFLLIYRQKAELKVLATYQYFSLGPRNLGSAAIGKVRDKNLTIPTQTPPPKKKITVNKCPTLFIKHTIEHLNGSSWILYTKYTTMIDIWAKVYFYQPLLFIAFMICI